MSGDTLTYDMSLMSEGSPQIFVKRDWLSIQDQQSGNYAGNQLVIDTSQLANSNKYTDYRNAYLSVPLVMAMSSVTDASGVSIMSNNATATTGSMSAGIQQVPSLKNWFGSIVSSMLLDYAGTTIIQNTPLCGLWNTFTLMTSLSMADVQTLGPTIGFYPDGSNIRIQAGDSASGSGTCNNQKVIQQGILQTVAGGSEFSNPGIQKRWSDLMINVGAASGNGGAAYSSLVSAQSMDQIYRSRVYSQTADGFTGGATVHTAFQIQAFIYLRHLHSFFSQIPLLKGVFFRLTLNLNQPIVTIESDGAGAMEVTEIISPLGGVSPIMIASQNSQQTALTSASGGAVSVNAEWGLPLSVAATAGSTMRVTLNVGNKLIDSTQKGRIPALTTGLNESCFLNVPMFTFNPAFESAYLSRPTKTIVYSDLYQYTTNVVSAGQQFNFLITNGISNIKSVIVLPMEDKIQGATQTYPPFWSPFDTCGGGTTMPLGGSAISNFNVVVAGQNMVYNQVTRAYEQFNNQLYGVNAVNAGLTDGMTSGLVSYWDFLQAYGYWYINCARQLPIDEAVPKSVSIAGTNLAAKSVQYYVFIEYGVQVNVDVLTGARV
jgi:hypothetical protein